MRKKRAVKNIFSSLLLQFVTIICGFIVPKLIIRTYGSSVNGLVSSITQFLSYITLLEAGFGPVIKASLYKPIAKRDKNTIAKILKTSEKYFRMIAYIFIIYILFLFFFYPMIVANKFDHLFSSSLVLIIAFSTFVEFYFGITYKLFLQAEQKNYITSFIQIILYILNIISVLILTKIGTSIHIVKLVTGLIFIIRPLFQNYYVKKKYNISLKGVENNYKIEQKWNGFVQHVAYVIHTNTDITLLTLFSSLENVSIYSVYYMIANGVQSFIRSISSSVSSSFGDMIAKNENINLNKKFGMYETIYLVICSIAFSCTLVLIVPFINVYTKNISDVNYINYLFGYFLVIGTTFFTIRTPYNDLVNVAGYFKEMQKGAILEALCNIIISIIFVSQYGLIGVAIGTVCAMIIRTFDLIKIVSKRILNRSIFVCIKKIGLLIFEMSLTFVLYEFVSPTLPTSYLQWGMNSIVVLIASSIISLLCNLCFYKDDMYNLYMLVKDSIKKRKKA